VNNPNERLRAEREAQTELERAEVVAEAAKRTQEVAQQAIKLGAEEKKELARRWGCTSCIQLTTHSLNAPDFNP
jgi:hypothetical protein